MNSSKEAKLKIKLNIFLKTLALFFFSTGLTFFVISFLTFNYWKEKIHKQINVISYHKTYYDSEKNLVATIEQTDSQAKNFSTIYYGKPIALSDIPLNCLQAIMSTEDKNFLLHQGVSPSGLLRAFWLNISKGRVVAGGSTITQQMVKNKFLTPERTLSRKWNEFWISLILEHITPKDKILESYLNIIYMGQNQSLPVRGINGGALYYFQKKPEELNLKECGFLAGVIQNPGRYNPYKHPYRALKRTELVLKRMHEEKLISTSLFKKIKRQPLSFKEPTSYHSKTLPHYLDVMKHLTTNLTDNKTEGFNIFTTLNSQFQKLAESSLSNTLDQLEAQHKINNLQGGLIIIDHQKGEVLAGLGTRNFKASNYNRVFSSRQVGSLMKPFIYLTAFLYDSNFSVLSTLPDSLVFYSYNNKTWAPRNYKNQYYKEVPAFLGLCWSLNAASVHLGMTMGLSKFKDTLSRLGLDIGDVLPSHLLGSKELSLLEVSSLYYNLMHFPRFPKKLTAIQNNLAVTTEQNQPTLDIKTSSLFSNTWSADQTARFLTLGLLRANAQIGTARFLQNFNFPFEVMGKTGTTNESKDSWFVGITPQWLVVSWVGKDDNTHHGLTGSKGALRVWADFLNKIQKFADPNRKKFNWPSSLPQRQLSEEEVDSLLAKMKKSSQESVSFLTPAEKQLWRTQLKKRLSQATLIFKK